MLRLSTLALTLTVLTPAMAVAQQAGNELQLAAAGEPQFAVAGEPQLAATGEPQLISPVERATDIHLDGYSWVGAGQLAPVTVSGSVPPGSMLEVRARGGGPAADRVTIQQPGIYFLDADLATDLAEIVLITPDGLVGASIPLELDPDVIRPDLQGVANQLVQVSTQAGTAGTLSIIGVQQHPSNDGLSLTVVSADTPAGTATDQVPLVLDQPVSVPVPAGLNPAELRLMLGIDVIGHWQITQTLAPRQ